MIRVIFTLAAIAACSAPPVPPERCIVGDPSGTGPGLYQLWCAVGGTYEPTEIVWMDEREPIADCAPIKVEAGPCVAPQEP